MSNKKTKLQVIDEIKDIRRQLQKINEIQHKNINDQLDLSFCKMMEHINEKLNYLTSYITKLQALSSDDVGKGLLDTIHDQLNDIKSKFTAILQLNQEFESTSDLENMKFILLVNSRLFVIIERLQQIEEILKTHIGEPTTEDI